MAVKKITYEEALERLRHSLNVKREAKQRMAEEFAREQLAGSALPV